jgi:hypothetical protein
VRAFIISTSLVLALTQVELAAADPPSANNSPSANEVMPGCRSLLKRYHAGQDYKVGTGTRRETDCGDLLYLFTLFREKTCIPEGVTTGQIVAVVVKYADEHPQDMHLEFAEVVASALVEAWPCKP